MPRDEIDKPPQPDAATSPLTLGDGALHPGRYNMAVVRKAIREGYPITEGIRQLVTSQMALVVGRSESEKNRIAAAKVLVTADAQNVKRAELALRTESLELDIELGNRKSTVNVNITLEATQQQAELASLAAEIRAGRVFESVPPVPAIGDSRADGETVDTGPARGDGDH